MIKSHAFLIDRNKKFITYLSRYLIEKQQNLLYDFHLPKLSYLIFIHKYFKPKGGFVPNNINLFYGTFIKEDGKLESARKDINCESFVMVKHQK